MKGFAGVALAALVSMGAFSVAYAARPSFTTTPGPENPVPGTIVETIDFNGPLPMGVELFGGTITNGSGGPEGDTTPYLSAGHANLSVSGDPNIYNNNVTDVGLYLGPTDSSDTVEFALTDLSYVTYQPTSSQQSVNLLLQLPSGVGVNSIFLDAGDNTFGADDINFYTHARPPVSAAPEPSTWALMILGIWVAGSSLQRVHRCSRTASATFA